MVPLLQCLEGTGGPEYPGSFSLHHHILVFGKAWTFGVRRAHRGRKGWKCDSVEPGTELESWFTHLLLLLFVASPFWVPRSPVCKILKLRTTSQSRVMKSSKMSGPFNTFDSLCPSSRLERLKTNIGVSKNKLDRMEKKTLMQEASGTVQCSPTAGP